MEWWQILTTIIGAIAGLGTFSGLGIFLIERYDKKCCNSFTLEEKKQVLDAVNKINTIELDTARLQLLNLIQHSPKNKDTILYQAQHYFKELHGNSYMVVVFCEWAKEQGIDEKVVNEFIHNE